MKRRFVGGAVLRVASLGLILLSLGCQPVDPATTTQIVADHTVVEKYSTIPDEWVAKVKQMWFDLPGESHSYGYRKGLQLLAGLAGQERFAVSVLDGGVPEGPTDAHLRASRATWGDYGNASGWRYEYGEEDWYTNALAIERTKGHLDKSNGGGWPIAAMGFGWCWDMTWGNGLGGTVDPVYGVQWAGSSKGGPVGSVDYGSRWGLDAADEVLTGNSVCMDSYLSATQQYVDYCAVKGYATKVFFTTGPVDGYSGESGYQRQLKQDHIRAYVGADGSRILFDYADILAWSDGGTQKTESWNGHEYQMIHPDNMVDMGGGYAEDGDHIGERGALRLGKAVWWMLARIAGWNGL